MTALWVRDPRARWRRSGGRVALAAPSDGEVMVLDSTAAVTWELLASPISEDEVVDILAEGFGEDVEVVRGSVVPFLLELCERGAARRL